jgi:lipoate-protein ligase A
VVCEGAKIAGSAQRRRRGAVLQHGSILLARSPAAPELPGIVELAGRHFAALEFANLWKSVLLQSLATTAAQDSLTFLERQRAESLVGVRFGSTEFALRR